VTEEDGPLAAGAEVRAAAEGRVIDICLLPQAVTCGPNGPFVAMEHRGGFRTIYAHLDPGSIAVRRKMSVARGQPLGNMGDAASESGPWVHFELRFENRGAGAASTLEALLVDGRKVTDYRLDPETATFYLSTNGADGDAPQEK
jgi:murein DD-endopeptidase MepM/ murein hydrolase activator NlpD